MSAPQPALYSRSRKAKGVVLGSSFRRARILLTHTYIKKKSDLDLRKKEMSPAFD